MTVGDVIDALSAFDRELNVYVPDQAGCAKIAKTISVLQHLNCPKGITIPSDVAITPWTEEEFNELFGTED